MSRDLILTTGAGELAAFPHIHMVGHRSVRKIHAGTLQPHLNPGIELCHIDKGRFDWTVEGQCCCVLPGTTTVTLPWQLHGGTREALDIGELSWIIVRPERFEPSGALRLGAWSSLPRAEQHYISRQLLAAPLPTLVPGQMAVRAAFREILAEVGSTQAGRVWRVNRLIDELLLFLARAIERSALETRRRTLDVTAIERAVRADPGRRWTLAELCDLSGWSKSALNPRMREATGYSSREYVTVLRLEAAKDLLSHTDRPITAIGVELGFSSSQHFSTVFRQRLGLSPMAFRGQAAKAGGMGSRAANLAGQGRKGGFPPSPIRST
jgi:AraC-like DNA-binding protein